jgi:prepilin-type N-terminal cleavage/methylation domain-containing protein
MRTKSSQSGFSLAELLVAMAIMLLISGAAVSALLRMTSAQATIWNRTQMHSGIRGATEVMQQEVGQAGRIALPGVVLTGTATSAGAPGATVDLTVTSTTGMFEGMKLTVGTGAAQQTLEIAPSGILSPTTVRVRSLVPTTGVVLAQANNAPVMVFGSFSSGVVPDNMTNGSSGSVLKLYGDINDDGKMVYIEYTCDFTSGNLYRNVMDFNATTKPALAASQVLLSNVVAYPLPPATPAPCFTYQKEVVNGTWYVTGVAITLTVRTQKLDPITQQYQLETKALLNVSPRNVFSAWQMASLTITERIQVMPPKVALLLPPLP